MASKNKTREEARLSLPDLADLIEQKRSDLKAIERIRDTKLRAMLRAMKKGAQVHPRDLVKEPEKLRHATYFHPTMEGITWSGWGRVPQWLVEALLEGATLEDLSTPRFVKPKSLDKPRKAKVTTSDILDGAYEKILRSAQIEPPERA